MDGYSVRAADTFGASDSMPAYLEIVGEVPMGRAPQITLGPGQVAVAYTGGMLAEAADAVVMIEHTHSVGEATIEVVRSVAPGENVVQSDEDVRAVAEYSHDVLSTATRQGGPPEGEPVELDILVGDAAAGEAYFAAQCASCHSPAGDLQGIASRIAEPKELQNTWVRGGSRTGPRPPVNVTVTTSSGQRIAGTLERLDDFVVVLTTTDGRHHSFSRRGGAARIELADPLARHRALLSLYSDTDIHNVTAYLVTLK